LTRVQATCDPDNIASQRVLEKAGFKKEGIIRKVGFNVGRIVDDCLYGILARAPMNYARLELAGGLWADFAEVFGHEGYVYDVCSAVIVHVAVRVPVKSSWN
jgi:hypothetical protein